MWFALFLALSMLIGLQGFRLTTTSTRLSSQVPNFPSDHFLTNRLMRSEYKVFMVNPKPSGFANTKAGKAAILERTKSLLDSSQIVISFPIDGVTKEQIDILRNEIPTTVKASVVKNSLMKIAVKGTGFEPIGSDLKDENMFFFIPEGEAKPAYAGFKKWQKEVKRTEPQFAAKVAVMDGNRYTGAIIDDIVKLPTRLELITKIAQGIKAVPTKVARGIKAVPNKVGRAFGAIRDKLEDEAKNA